jgi:hypothetical protein
MFVAESNRRKLVSRFLIGLCLFLLIGTSIVTISRGNVRNPAAIIGVIIGLGLTLITKVVMLLTKSVGFGSTTFAENLEAWHRMGYWLTIMGFILTFVDS